jgi:hypothetical protein
VILASAMPIAKLREWSMIAIIAAPWQMPMALQW